MKKFGRAGSTFGTVVAAALVLAVATTGGAIAGGLVTSAKIKNNTIKSIDVRNNTLKSVDVRDGELTGSDVADGSLTRGDFTSSPIGLVRGYVYSGTAAPALNTPVDITSSPYVYNSGGGAVTRTRTGTGEYSVTFGGLDLNAGNVQVTGYGSTEAAIACKVASWGGSTALVLCFDDAGAPQNSRFTLAFIR